MHMYANVIFFPKQRRWWLRWKQAYVLQQGANMYTKLNTADKILALLAYSPDDFFVFSNESKLND